MAFRISMAYLRLLLTHGILFLMGFLIIYMYSEKTDYDRMTGNVLQAIRDEGISGITNPYDGQGFTMKVTERKTGKVLYNDLSSHTDIKQSIFGVHINFRSQSFILEKNKKIKTDNTYYNCKFRYDMTLSFQEFLDLAWKVALLYLFIVFIIIRKAKRSDIKLFEPVRIMSAQANRLTVNNLHSERLNVEGTKNELKDLANVINAMLDRIETSYESQKQFVSDASHELRTPIAVIQGYANLLNRWGSANPEVLQESIEAIQNESRSMQDLVEKLLFLSRHDKKTLKLTKKNFNMRRLVDDMVKETKLVAVNRIINSPVMEDVIVYGDKQALKQAIRIFIDNAVKYTHDGDEIRVSCQKVNEDCVITVCDTGIGMTRKDVDHIFDRFYRSEYVRNQNISGHGLGLSLAKLIILAHTGRIKVRSQFKKGTSFIVTLPKRRY
jgi:signal transduction histidine kinase